MTASPPASQEDSGRQRTDAMTPVDELTGAEEGQWEVLTQRSSYRFDFEVGTVTRIPGPGSSRTINDCPRRILEIKACRIGSRGYWIMHPDGAEDTTEYFWQSSSEVRQIRKLPEGSN